MLLSEQKGIGTSRIAALRLAGIEDAVSLLMYLPQSYRDLSRITPISDLSVGMPAVIRARILRPPTCTYIRGMSIVRAAIQDESGKLSVTYFNQPWMQKQLHEGDVVTLSSRLLIKNKQKQFVNPTLEKENGIRPVYKAIKGFPTKLLRELISRLILEEGFLIVEPLPESILSEYSLMPINDAIREAHIPQSEITLKEARRRLSFENLLMYQCAILGVKKRRGNGFLIDSGSDTSKSFWSRMPYKPTNAQIRVTNEIYADLSSQTAMARLVQGDVGCGKTAIAFAAIYAAFKSGYQSALMAPTEILARQHYESAKKLLEPFGISCGLFIGGMKAKERRDALESIKSGEWQLVIGTHALISKGVEYHNLGLAITDEQHRFGVNQRQTLADKGKNPHVLVLSATPIPRSLALILYGDLDVSIVDELPPGRTAVRTRIVSKEKRDLLFGFVRDEVRKGRQAYIVCPLVEEDDEAEDVKSAKAVLDELVNGQLSGLRLGLTYGSQRSGEKAEVIGSFASGELDVLVATTVIEVGVNVPNATIMVIENAERYGLSQLHQLRGRVGRGSEQSWCFLEGEKNERLDMMTKTNDGFEIAQKDLELRGPGDLFGTAQHGAMELFGDAAGADIRLIQETQALAKRLRSELDTSDEARALFAAANDFVDKKGLKASLS
ncbi:MAG: ATP-dependent DNA helicase RecG [Eubacteriales bacterium]|nr:ATP-dependent DNA helicase RecG [Eubacteriales bacterium]MDD3881547.1 ATP-dependent DNA helicase RecG [Eubacteriales bacterium]MDD4513383.1 ATP-dependent DNA helicase RecG [Eubacteriales bacterium]